MGKSMQTSRQLELPVLVDVRSKVMPAAMAREPRHEPILPSEPAHPRIKAASQADLSIYEAITASYFTRQR